MTAGGRAVGRLYTGKGDRGRTWCGLAGGETSKAHPCVEFVGALDEAEATVALARALAAKAGAPRMLIEMLEMVEDTLFAVGFALAGRAECIRGRLGPVEEAIDKLWKGMEPGFRLNGATVAAAAAAVARTAVRRAERRLWACIEASPNTPAPAEEAARLLNRLSDLLYVLQRRLDTELGEEPPRPSCS